MYSPAFFTKLLVSSLLVLLISCNKDNDDATPDTTIPGKEYVLQEVQDGSGNTLAQYEYNTNWQVTKYIYWYKYNRSWVYNTYTYTYDSNNKLTRVVMVPLSSPFTNISKDYSYDSQGRIVLIKIYQTGQLSSTSEVTYNGNIITETNFVAGAVYSVTTYTLDDRGNLIKKVLDISNPGQADTFEEWSDYDDHPAYVRLVDDIVASKNNPGKYTYSVESIFQRHTFTYLYNNAGYVKERKKAINDDRFFVEKYIVIPKQ